MNYTSCSPFVARQFDRDAQFLVYRKLHHKPHYWFTVNPIFRVTLIAPNLWELYFTCFEESRSLAIDAWPDLPYLLGMISTYMTFTIGTCRCSRQQEQEHSSVALRPLLQHVWGQTLRRLVALNIRFSLTQRISCIRTKFTQVLLFHTKADLS